MKKLILGACAALMVAGVSCSKKEADTNALPRELTDSISIYSGTSIGAYVLSDYLNYVKNSETEISKKDILKGVQLAFANSDEGTLVGLQIGAQLLNQIKRYNDEGIAIDRELLLKNFRKVFDADTVDMTALTASSNRLDDLLTEAHNLRAEQMKAAAADERNARQAQDNEYIAKLKEQDPEIQTSPSGLSYKIINPGEEPRVQDNSSIQVYYVGRLTDGTVFDQTQDSPATFSPSGVIPGFAEGLKMLGKGGKAILYIPGELAYGENGVPQAGIGPNAMLVFEVEIADVQNPE